MHPYHVDNDLRTRVFLVSAFVAILDARIFYIFLQTLPFSMPWWVETPSVLGFFGFTIWLYDHFLWRLWPFRQLKSFYLPDLNGSWTVELVSSFAEFRETVQAMATIRQTASRMCVALQTDQSSSYSIYATLLRTDRLNTFELIYHYVNQPRAEALKSMNIHYGTTWLRISENANTLEGDYYSGRGRQHFGRVTFARQTPERSSKRLDEISAKETTSIPI